MAAIPYERGSALAVGARVFAVHPRRLLTMDRDEVIALALKFDMRKGRRPRTPAIRPSKPALATRSDVEAAARLYDERLARASAYARKRRRDGKSTGPTATRPRTGSVVGQLQNIETNVSPAGSVASPTPSHKVEYQTEVFQYHHQQPPQVPNSNQQQMIEIVAQNQTQNSQVHYGPHSQSNGSGHANHPYENQLQIGQTNQVLVYGPQPQPTSNDVGGTVYEGQDRTNTHVALYENQSTTNNDTAVYQPPAHPTDDAAVFSSRAQAAGDATVYEAQPPSSDGGTGYGSQDGEIYQTQPQPAAHEASVYDAEAQPNAIGSVYDAQTQNSVQNVNVFDTQAQATSDGSVVFQAQAQAHQTSPGNTVYEPPLQNPSAGTVYQPHDQDAIENPVYETQESNNGTVATSLGAYGPTSAQAAETVEVNHFGERLNTDQAENIERVGQSGTNAEISAFGHEQQQVHGAANVGTYVVDGIQGVVYSEQVTASHGEVALVDTARRQTESSFDHELDAGQTQGFEQSFEVDRKEADMMNDHFDTQNDEPNPSGVDIDGDANGGNGKAGVHRMHSEQRHETEEVGDWESTNTPGLNVESVIVMNGGVGPRETVEPAHQSSGSSTSVMHPIDQSVEDDSLGSGPHIALGKRTLIISSSSQKEKC